MFSHVFRSEHGIEDSPPVILSLCLLRARDAREHGVYRLFLWPAAGPSEWPALAVRVNGCSAPCLQWPLTSALGPLHVAHAVRVLYDLA